jgi:hypothetical protein
MPRTSAALVNYFNDEDMLKLQVASGQFGHYDRVFIFDGPYSYAEASPVTSTAQPRLCDTEFGRELLADPKYVYEWAAWPDERAKRIHAYEHCKADVIVLHDSDEFYAYNTAARDEFLAGAKGVAHFTCQNLCLDGQLFAARKLTHMNDLPWKAFMFRPDLVGAEDHLDYLWLVGVDQRPPDQSKAFRHPIATGYHLTQMRSRSGQRQKCLFYGSLYNSQNKGSRGAGVIAGLEEMVHRRQLDAHEATDIYLRGMFSFTSAPEPDRKVMLQQRFIVDSLELVLQRALQERSRFEPARFPVFEAWPLSFYAESARFSSLRIHSSEPLHVKILGYPMDSLERLVLHDGLASPAGLEITVPAALHGVMVTAVRRGAPVERLGEVTIDVSPRS